MRRLVTGLCLMAFTASAFATSSTVREVQTRAVSPTSQLPADLSFPEGKTRWHLESIDLGTAATVTISKDDSGFAQDTRRTGQAGPSRVVVSGTDAERWLLPDRDPSQMKMGARVRLQFDETRDGLVDRLTAEVATVGIGWLHLPGDPQEVVLQRVLLFRQRAGERAMRPDLLIHRWVSPREGVLATISGAPSADGRTRLAASSIEFVEKVLTGASTLKIYADQLYRGNFTDVKYGYDKGVGTLVSSLVPEAPSNMCDLINLPTWNFSGVTSGQETATTETPSTSAETCRYASCGYAGYPPGGALGVPILERLDRNLTGTVRKDNQVVQRENRANDVTIWLRSGTQNEGASGSFGAGETRFCFTDEASKPRNEVPVWRLAHNDASGWYTQTGDTWGSDPVIAPACEESFYNCQCPSNCTGLFQTLYGRSCTNGTNPAQPFSGSQFSKVVKGGVVTLPTGHTVNALALRLTTEFCTYGDSACTVLFSTVRTIVYVFEAPYIGAVALLRGPQRSNFTQAEITAGAETPCTTFTSLDFTDVMYGLLPPVSINTTGMTNTSVSLSWFPGNDTHRISGYKVYWDTDPGASTAYAFNSVANAGQVVFTGTSATVSGLTPGTTYYFTVTSLSDFTDPSTGVVTRYESILYPTTVSGDPNFSYPVEVAAETAAGTCLPNQEVTGLTVSKGTPPNSHVCWNASTDPCTDGYDVLGSDNAKRDTEWGVVGQVGLTNCWDGDARYIVVRARGNGGTGPWGHYGH